MQVILLWNKRKYFIKEIHIKCIFFLIIESGHPSKGEGCDFILEGKTDKQRAGYPVVHQKKNIGSSPVEI